MIAHKTYFFLVHGLATSSKTLKPVEYLIKSKGFYNVYNIQYNSTQLRLSDSIQSVHNNILRIINKNDAKNSIIIGQSLGGVIAMNLHRKTGFKPRAVVSIASPLQGCRFLKSLKGILPNSVQDHYYKPVYSDLMDMSDNINHPPEHEYYTISTSLPKMEFDGLIHTDETYYDISKHVFIRGHDHFTLFGSPLMLSVLSHKINEITKN